jgi:hypothetical protein
MSDRIRLADYCYTTVPDKPGEGARLLGRLRDAGVNLLAFTAFPSARRSQVDLITSDTALLLTAAKQAKIKVSSRKAVFLIDGMDRIGAVAEILGRLATAKVNVTAIDAVCSGEGRFGAMLWVKPRDVKKAAQALGVATA